MSPLWFISFDIAAGILGSLHFIVKKPIYACIEGFFARRLTQSPTSRVALVIAGAIVSAIILMLIINGIYTDLTQGDQFVRDNTVRVTIFLAFGLLSAIAIFGGMVWFFDRLNRSKKDPTRSTTSWVMIISLFSIFLVFAIAPSPRLIQSFILAFMVTTMMLGVGMSLAWYAIRFLLIQEHEQLMARAGVLVFLVGKLIQFSDHVDLIRHVNNLVL